MSASNKAAQSMRGVHFNDKAIPLRALHGKDNELKQVLRVAVQEIDALEAA